MGWPLAAGRHANISCDAFTLDFEEWFLLKTFFGTKPLRNNSQCYSQDHARFMEATGEWNSKHSIYICTYMLECGQSLGMVACEIEDKQSRSPRAFSAIPIRLLCTIVVVCAYSWVRLSRMMA